MELVYLSAGVVAGSALTLGLKQCHERTPRNTPPSWDSASVEACAQSEQVCHAVAERMGIVVTIPPWQAMVLTPILDPR